MRTEAPYVVTVAMAAALAVIFLVPVGCSPREAADPALPPAAPPAPTTPTPPVEPPSPPDASPTPSTEPQQAEPSAVPAAPPVSTPAAPATPPVPELPAATSPPSTAPPTAAPPSPPVSAAPPPAAPQPSDSQPAPDARGVVDPGGEIAVEATRPGLTRVGAAKCGVCHKLQYASWSESAHARRKPPLDCESCPGSGIEYKTLAVRKDADRAKAAGLVLPGAAFCATCHRQGWTDDQLRKAHAHKEPPKP